MIGPVAPVRDLRRLLSYHARYDGWGNLTDKGGSVGVPYLSTTIDPSTNGSPGPSGVPANPAPSCSPGSGCNNPIGPYDVTGHKITDGAGTWYTYDPWGRRLWQETIASPGAVPTGNCKLMFYSIDGQRLTAFNGVYDNSTGTPTMSVSTDTASPGQPAQRDGTRVYFGSKLIMRDGGNVGTDRLGSVRFGGTGGAMSYYPYGEERTSTPNGQEKFGTYFRDANGDDYAMARTTRAMAEDSLRQIRAVLGPLMRITR